MFDVFVVHCGILACSPGAFLEADKLVFSCILHICLWFLCVLISAGSVTTAHYSFIKPAAVLTLTHSRLSVTLSHAHIIHTSTACSCQALLANTHTNSPLQLTSVVQIPKYSEENVSGVCLCKYATFMPGFLPGYCFVMAGVSSGISSQKNPTCSLYWGCKSDGTSQFDTVSILIVSETIFSSKSSEIHLRYYSIQGYIDQYFDIMMLCAYFIFYTTSYIFINP